MTDPAHPGKPSRPDKPASPAKPPASRGARPHGHRPRAWGRWVRRVLRHSLWVTALVLIGVGTFLYYAPISSGALDRRIASLIERASGMQVTFGSAQLYAAQRRYAVADIEVRPRDAATTAPPALTIRRAEARVYPLSLLFGRSTYLDSILLVEPSELDLEYSRQGVKPGPKSELLARALANIQPRPEGEQRALPFRSLRITEARVSVSEAGSTRTLAEWLGGPGKARPGMRLRELDLTVEPGKDNSVETALRGVAEAGGTESGIEGRVAIRPDHWLKWSLEMPEAHLAGFLSGYPRSAATVTRLRVLGEVSLGAKKPQGRATVEADAWSLRVPESGLMLSDASLKADAKVAFDREAGVFRIAEASVRAALLDAETRGAVGIEPPNAFDLKMVARKLGAPYRTLLARLLPAGWKVDAADDSFLLDAAVTGDRHGVESVIGKLVASNVTVTPRGLPHPLEGLKGELNFEPGRVVLHNLEGRSNRTRVSLSGEVRGDYLRTREGDLNLQWEAVAAPEDILSIVRVAAPDRTQLPSAPVRPTGEVATSGTWVQHLGAGGTSGVPEIHGDVQVRRVTLTHPLLPNPVEDLNGTLRVRNNRVLVDSARGRSNRSNFTFKGAIGGVRSFWEDPWVTGTLGLALDLSEIASYVPPRHRDEARRFNPRGRAGVSLKVNAALAHLDRPELTGDIEVSDMSFNPGLDFMNAGVRGLQGSLHWDGQQLRLDRCTADVGPERLRASGLLSREAIMLGLGGSIRMESIGQVFPRTSRWIEVSGPARGEVRFSLRDDAAPAPAAANPDSGGALAQLLTGAAERVNRAVAERRFLMDGEVTLGTDAQGVTFRHRAMPPGRTEGRTRLPRAEVRDLRGSLVLAGTRVTVPERAPLTGSAADTPDCRLHGDFEIRPGNWPKLSFTLTTAARARFDTWVFGWGSEKPPANLPPPVETGTGKVFDMDARILTNGGGTFRGQTANKVALDIGFRSVQGQTQPKRTEFRRVDVQGFGGTLRGQGTIESAQWLGPERSPAWRAETTVNGMRIQQLATCLFGEAPRVDGVITADARVSGIGTRRDSYRGDGTASVSDVQLARSPALLRLFQLPVIMQNGGGRFGNSLFATTRPARFSIGGGAVSVDNLPLATQGMLLGIRGRYFFGNQLDLLVRLKFLESSLLGELPIIDEAAKIFDTLAGQILAFRVRGSSENPVVEPAPLNLLTPQ